MQRNSFSSYVRPLVIALALGSMLVLGSCVVDMSISDDVAETSLESTAAESSPEASWSKDDGFEPEALCPLMWTCDATSSYYFTEQECLANANCHDCYLAYRCRPNCTCPGPGLEGAAE